MPQISIYKAISLLRNPVFGVEIILYRHIVPTGLVPCFLTSNSTLESLSVTKFKTICETVSLLGRNINYKNWKTPNSSNSFILTKNCCTITSKVHPRFSYQTFLVYKDLSSVPTNLFWDAKAPEAVYCYSSLT